MLQGKLRQIGHSLGIDYFMKSWAWRHKMNSLIHYNNFSRPEWNASLKVSIFIICVNKQHFMVKKLAPEVNT